MSLDGKLLQVKMNPTGKRPNYRIHKSGCRIPPHYSLQNIDDLLKYEPEKGDIFVMTFPKSGTTWTEYIVYLLMNDCRPIPTGKSIHDIIPYLHVGMKAALSLPRPRVMKIHMSFEWHKHSEKAKYICVVRNPKDCCVSFYNHIMARAKDYDFDDGTFDDFFEAFMDGQTHCNSYFDHLLCLYQYRNKPNVLFLLFEDMKTDTTGAVRKIAEFLSSVLPEDVKFSDGLITRVVEMSSFDRMKKSEETFRPPNQESRPFIRKGVVGDWTNFLSKEQNLRMENKFFGKLGGTGAENLWNEYGVFTNIKS